MTVLCTLFPWSVTEISNVIGIALYMCVVLCTYVGGYLRVCYHTNWSQYRPNDGKFTPVNIDPSLCSHIIFAFGKLEGNTIMSMEWNDESSDMNVGMYAKVNNFKQTHTHLKTLLAIGGWNAGSVPFSDMASSSDSRKVFISSAIDFLRQRNFDGLGIDWEYPGLRGGMAEDKTNLVSLLSELKLAFEQESYHTGRPRLMLTATVPAIKSHIDAGFDIPNVIRSLDFINVMTYDFHGPWELVTGHNSPLYGRAGENADDASLNMDWALNYWSKHGAPKNKLVIGMGFYGRSFQLQTATNHGIGAPTVGAGQAGIFTRETGFMSYYEVCEEIKHGAVRVWDKEHKVPYIHRDDLWVAYDDEESVRIKIQWMQQNGYGGVMIWALPLDDFSGKFCNKGPYPLLRAINIELGYNLPSNDEPFSRDVPDIGDNKQSSALPILVNSLPLNDILYNTPPINVNSLQLRDSSLSNAQSVDMNTQTLRDSSLSNASPTNMNSLPMRDIYLNNALPIKGNSLPLRQPINVNSLPLRDISLSKAQPIDVNALPLRDLPLNNAQPIDVNALPFRGISLSNAQPIDVNALLLFLNSQRNIYNSTAKGKHFINFVNTSLLNKDNPATSVPHVLEYWSKPPISTISNVTFSQLLIPGTTISHLPEIVRNTEYSALNLSQIDWSFTSTGVSHPIKMSAIVRTPNENSANTSNQQNNSNGREDILLPVILHSTTRSSLVENNTDLTWNERFSLVVSRSPHENALVNISRHPLVNTEIQSSPKSRVVLDSLRPSARHSKVPAIVSNASTVQTVVLASSQISITDQPDSISDGARLRGKIHVIKSSAESSSLGIDNTEAPTLASPDNLVTDTMTIPPSVNGALVSGKPRHESVAGVTLLLPSILVSSTNGSSSSTSTSPSLSVQIYPEAEHQLNLEDLTSGSVLANEISNHTYHNSHLDHQKIPVTHQGNNIVLTHSTTAISVKTLESLPKVLASFEYPVIPTAGSILMPEQNHILRPIDILRELSFEKFLGSNVSSFVHNNHWMPQFKKVLPLNPYRRQSIITQVRTPALGAGSEVIPRSKHRILSVRREWNITSTLPVESGRVVVVSSNRLQTVVSNRKDQVTQASVRSLLRNMNNRTLRRLANTRNVRLSSRPAQTRLAFNTSLLRTPTREIGLQRQRISSPARNVRTGIGPGQIGMSRQSPNRVNALNVRRTASSPRRSLSFGMAQQTRPSRSSLFR